MSDDADSHELLSVVAAVHHERVGKTLNDGALGLAETLDGVTASRVGEVDGLTDLDVVAARKNKELASSSPSSSFSGAATAGAAATAFYGRALLVMFFFFFVSIASSSIFIFIKNDWICDAREREKSPTVQHNRTNHDKLTSRRYP